MKDIFSYYDVVPKRLDFLKMTIEDPNLTYKKRGQDAFRDMFFSNQNIDNIKNVIVYKVYQKTNLVINKESQSNANLFMEMEFIYDIYSKHPQLITEELSESEKKDLMASYQQQIEYLNNVVINRIYPNVVLEVSTQIDYNDYTFTKNKQFIPEVSKGRRN